MSRSASLQAGDAGARRGGGGRWGEAVGGVMIRGFAVALGAALLAACAVFAPGYDPVIDEKATQAYEEVARVLAEVELGRYAEPASYEASAAQYPVIDAQLAVAEMRARTLTVSGERADRARELIVSQIRGCREQMKSLADQHRTTGVPPGVGATQPVMVSCDLALRAVRQMKP